ncbi:hypothetical protein SDC9_107759 [bioreactor metagenome]|uniref:HTH tetR-type domain-containing protein n=1 Tax=bioreactor metagenome TaxID=1076179 RepID=A0A645B650_9ZZZZ
MDFANIENESKAFVKPAFLNIPEEKQERILKVAMSEFAENGLIGTNVNVIAKKADISIGSLYNYFESKEDIFLAIASRGLKTMVNTVMVALSFSSDVLSELKLFVKVLINFIKEENELILLYNEVAYSANNDIITPTAKFARENLIKIYKSAISEAQNDGYIRNDISVEMLTFYLDAIFTAIRMAYSSDTENCLHSFISNDSKEDTDQFVDEFVKLIVPSLEPPQN